MTSSIIKNKIRNLSFFDVIKIAILLIVSISLIANFYPYWLGSDSYVYGVTAINFVNGSYEYESEFLQETGNWEFVPYYWAITVHNSAVSFASPGMVGISTFFYLIAGQYGLLYQGPILTILFLVVSERIATKWFGGFVGLVTLALLATDWVILKHGILLMTDSIFSLFFLLGCYYLIKFFSEAKEKFVLLCSILFVASSFVRYNGIIFFPIEVLLVVGYFVYQGLIKKENQLNSKNYKLINKIKFSLTLTKIFKISTFILVPWLVVFLFMFSYNFYYFGDPFTNYYEVADVPGKVGRVALGGITIPGTDEPELFSSLVTFDSYRFEWMNFYSASILPDVLKFFLQSFSTLKVGDNLDANFGIGIISILILISAIIISHFTKKKRIEIIVLFIFTICFLLFFSSYYLTNINLSERWVVAALPLSFMLFGFIIHQIWKNTLGRILINKPKIFFKSIKYGFVIGLILFAVVTFYDNQYTQKFVESGITFNNPIEMTNRFPLEKLPEQSIIVEGSNANRAVEYNAIFFNGGIDIWTQDGCNSDEQLQEGIQKLKNLLEDGYQTFTFKENRNEVYPHYFRCIENVHDIILKEYSKTFCKLELEKNVSLELDDQVKLSDDACYIYKGIVIPKPNKQ